MGHKGGGKVSPCSLFKMLIPSPQESPHDSAVAMIGLRERGEKSGKMQRDRRKRGREGVIMTRKRE